MRLDQLKHMLGIAALNPFMAPALARFAQSQAEAEKYMRAIRAVTGASEERIKRVAATKPYEFAAFYREVMGGNKEILRELQAEES